MSELQHEAPVDPRVVRHEGMTGFEWPDPHDLGAQLARARAEASRLRAGLEQLITEAERRPSDRATTRLVATCRLRRLLDGGRL